MTDSKLEKKKSVNKHELNRQAREGEIRLLFATLEDYEIIGDFKYVNARQRINVRHLQCGRELDVKISKFVGEGSRCPEAKCFTEKRVSHLRKDVEFYEFVAGKYELPKGFVYKGIRQRTDVTHIKCGTAFSATIGDLKRGNATCPKCKTRKDAVGPKFIDTVERSDGYELVRQKDAEKYRSETKEGILHSSCGAVFDCTVHNFISNDSRCPKCSNVGPSKPEQEVAEFIRNITPDIITSDRSLIAPKELDVYVPSRNFAVEFNGLYWHTTDFVSKKYHKEKTEECASKDVQLFHIFSDEWEKKPQVVKSMIRHRLGVTSRRIFARKCEVREVPNNISRDFFDATHIAGKTRYKKAFGLYYNDELVSCVSVKRPIQKKHGDNVLEISRFASALDTVVVGGFQKIFKKVIEYAREEKYEKILTYADRRFSEGGAYKKAGFTQLAPTSTGYFYTDGKVRHFRFKFRAQKPDPSNGMIKKTEKQVAIEAGVAQIHDCGHNVYLLEL